MKNPIKTIRNERATEAPVKNDYAALVTAITGEIFDKSINNSNELAEAADAALSILREFQRFCLEERFLRGKTPDEPADELRKAFENGDYTDEFIEDTAEAIHADFMTSVEEILSDMESDSFKALRELHKRKKAENDGANGRIVDIAYNCIDTLDDAGYCYGDIFRGYFLEGESKTGLAMALSDNPTGGVEVTEERISAASEALLERVSERLEEMFYEMMDNGFPEWKAADDGDYPPVTADSRVIDVLKDTIYYSVPHGAHYRDIFEKHFVQGLPKDQLSKIISENMKEYVSEAISAARRRLLVQGKGRALIQLAKKLNPPVPDKA